MKQIIQNKYKYFVNIFILVLFISQISNPILNAQEFIEGQNIPGEFPRGAEFVDVDGDNDLDLIIIFHIYNAVSNTNANEVWLNDGTGAYTYHMNIGESKSYNFDVGDLDNDNDIDIFVANTDFYTSAQASNKVWLNDGHGYFTSNGQSLGILRSNAVTLADFDGDNDLDAFVGNAGNDNRQNKVWINDGTGQFTDSGQLLGSWQTQEVKSFDVDMDGDMDVVSANSQSTPNRIWLNDGTGTFSDSGQELGSSSSIDIAYGDFNGDSYVDIIFANSDYEGSDSKQYLNDGNGIFSFHSNVFPGLNTRSIISADFDNDNDLDFMIGVWSINDANTITLKINDGAGNYTDGIKITESNNLNLAHGDVDMDGDIDVFTINNNYETSNIWINKLLTTQVITADETSLFCSIYPNPTTHKLNVNFKQQYNFVQIAVKNMFGQVVFTENYDLCSSIDIELVGKPGVYFLEIVTSESETATLKVLKI